MKRQVWAVAELVDVLRSVAFMGGDVKTLAAVCLALGIVPDFGALPLQGQEAGRGVGKLEAPREGEAWKSLSS